MTVTGWSSTKITCTRCGARGINPHVCWWRRLKRRLGR